MAARNKQELTESIVRILSTNTEVKSVAEADRLRRETAEKLANEIDSYVQHQIGTRLQQILTAVNSVGSDNNPVRLVQGPEFNSFTRTS